METEEKLKKLQVFYAAVLADTTMHYGQAGILEEVSEKKYQEQLKTGLALASRLGISEAKDVFEKTQEIYGCADWHLENTTEGFVAKCQNCLLCQISKQKSQFSPCEIFCLSPLKAMTLGLKPQAEFLVKQTLFTKEACVVEVKLSGEEDEPSNTKG